MRLRLLLNFALLLLISACQPAGAPTATPPPALVRLYNWEDDLPAAVLEKFTAQTGFQVEYLAYPSMEEALDELRAGKAMDVVNLDSRFLPQAIQEGLLLELEQARLPNLRFIAANFRDLVYDPGNHYSIPYNWGTTGLVVRTDLALRLVTRWADLWDYPELGKIGLWMGQSRETMGMALRSLGYSANTTEPAEIEAALQRLLLLKERVVLLDDEEIYSSIPLLASGDVAIAMGFAFDAVSGQEDGLDIAYVLPEEGSLLWGENFTIARQSANPEGAHALIDFLMTPEISAEIVAYNHYATPNLAAIELLDPAVRDDPLIFPANADIQNAEILLPLSAEVEALYQQAWERFLAAVQ